MNSENYVPDISFFFPERKNTSINELLASTQLRQETVTFDKNDFYIKKSDSMPVAMRGGFSKKRKKRYRNRGFRRSYS